MADVVYPGARGAGLARQSAAPFLAIAALLALALALRWWAPLAPDVSWLLTASEAMYRGQAFGVDVIEPNPPASLWMYLPSILIAAHTPLSAEQATVAVVLALLAASFVLSDRIARAGGLAASPAARAWLFAAALAVFAVAPLNVFAQREHYSVLLMCPALAVLVTRARGGAPAFWLSMAAAVCAGVAMAIKPHFAAAFGLAILAAAWSGRSWRILFARENFAAAAVAGLYMAAALALYPEYFRDLGPVLLDIYVPLRADFTPGKWGPALIFACLLLALAAGCGRTMAQPALLVPVAAACGFLLAYAVQLKFWHYHAYPALALLTMTALAAAIAAPRLANATGPPGGSLFARLGVPPHLAAAAVACLVFLRLFASEADWREFARKVAAAHPAPQVLAIGSNLGVGHPVTRLTGGSWAGTTHSQWIVSYAGFRLAQGGLDEAARARISGYMQWSRDMLAKDFLAARPDVVLIEQAQNDWLEWAKQDVRIAGALGGFEKVDSFHKPASDARIDIYARRGAQRGYGGQERQAAQPGPGDKRPGGR